ncbi:cytochrome P450 4d2-like [Cochliomyia hominivorax]
MFLIIILTIVFIFLLTDYLHKKRVGNILKASGIGGTKFTLPFIGDILLALGLNVENFDQYQKRWLKNYGKVYRLWYLRKCLLMVQDIEYVENILSSQHLLKRPFVYEQASIWLGDGLLLSTGLKWQTFRKVLVPTFNIKILEQFVEIFDQQSHIMVEKLRPLANGTSVIDVYPLVCSTTLDMLLETLMGVKMSSHSPEGLAYMKALKGLLDILNERFLKPFQQFDFVFKLLSYKSYKSLQENVKILHTFSENIINKKRSEMMNKNAKLNMDENEDNEFGLKKRMSFLDVLLQTTIDGKPLTNKEIREEVDTFTFGGHDTTTSAISFILYLLSRHPKEQQKVFEEIVNIIGPDPNQAVDMKKLQEMKYLELVIKESLRFYPPVPAIGRLTEKDFKFGEKMIPRNTHVMILISAICRDPDYFASPNEFLPKRFENEKINPYAFLPFSAGPRNCIGQKFAYLQMKSVVSCVLRHYELLPLGVEVQSTIMFITTSKTGMNIGLKPRIY